MNAQRGFVKLCRGEDLDFLLKHRTAMHLLTVIANRARYSSGMSPDGLTYGQSYIGDRESYGLTRKEDRCARRFLEKFRFARFERAANGAGTVATLVDGRVFDVGGDRPPNWGHREANLFERAVSEVKSSPSIIGLSALGATEGPPKGPVGAVNKNERKEEEKPSAPSASEKRVSLTKGEALSDPLFCALAQIDGSDLTLLTPIAVCTIQKALKEILAASPELTDSMIMKARTNYRRKFPSAQCTPMALAKHWAAIGGSTQRPKAPEDEEPCGWRSYVDEHMPTIIYARNQEREGWPWAEMESAFQKYISSEMRFHETRTARHSDSPPCL